MPCNVIECQTIALWRIVKKFLAWEMFLNEMKGYTTAKGMCNSRRSGSNRFFHIGRPCSRRSWMNSLLRYISAILIFRPASSTLPLGHSKQICWWPNHNVRGARRVSCITQPRVFRTLCCILSSHSSEPWRRKTFGIGSCPLRQSSQQLGWIDATRSRNIPSLVLDAHAAAIVIAAPE